MKKHLESSLLDDEWIMTKSKKIEIKNKTYQIKLEGRFESVDSGRKAMKKQFKRVKKQLRKYGTLRNFKVPFGFSLYLNEYSTVHHFIHSGILNRKCKKLCCG